MELDVSENQKIYMIRKVSSSRYCGFRLSDTKKPFPYQYPGRAYSYIKKHANNISDYEVDVFVKIHHGLREVDRKMYSKDPYDIR